MASSSRASDHRQRIAGLAEARSASVPTSSHTATDAARPFTLIGSSALITKRRSSAEPTAALMNTWPGCALVISRAARFITSPIPV